MAKKYWILTGIGIIVFAAVLMAAPRVKMAYVRANIQPEMEFSAALERMGTLESFSS